MKALGTLDDGFFTNCLSGIPPNELQQLLQGAGHIFVFSLMFVFIIEMKGVTAESLNGRETQNLKLETFNLNYTDAWPPS